MGLWLVLTAMLGGLAASLWRLAEARFDSRPLPLRLAFPGIAVLAMVFTAAQGWSVLRELRGLRAEQRRLAARGTP
jgi:hypothetical protein